ncbi:MAG TPA: type II toxin-antitoxin system ParD family antitoxin [Tepidisphaeraceae bacterium]
MIQRAELLNPETHKLIEDCVQRGGYASADDAVRAGLDSLRQLQALEEFSPGELDALLQEGEQSGTPLDGEQVLSELSALRNSHREKAG